MFRRFIAQLFKKQSPPPSERRVKPRTRTTLSVTQMEDRIVPTSVVTIAAIADATEGGSNGTFRLTRTDTSSPISVTLTTSGTAGSVDFMPSSLNVFFFSGVATADVTISASNDMDSEPTETVIATISSGSGYTVGTPASATVNILDNDAQVVTVAKIGDTTEGIAGAYQFTRTGNLASSLTANFSVSGTATSGTDFTALGTTVTFNAGSNIANLSLEPLADNSVESSETVIVTVGTGSGYSVGSPSAATITISDDPPVISIEASDTSEGSATGGFTLIRTGGNIASALTVTYSVSGTATSGTDYTALSGTATFAAGEVTVAVDVQALGDNTVDDAETVIATLTGAGSTYTIDGAADDATVIIADEPLTISVLRLTDGFEGLNDGSFRFTRSGDITSALTVSYTVSGTGTSGSDFTALSGTVTFAANSDHTDVTVSVTNDSGIEPTETVTVTIDEDDDYQLGNDSDTLFIKDNDTTKVYWVSTGSTDWTVASNWSSGTVPVAGQDVYFNGSGGSYYSNVSCTNAGSGLSGNLSGLHVVGSYSGTVTMATALSVGTYEQTSGTLDQTASTRNLTITDAILWSGGTLNATDCGAVVNVEGADGLIDPPDTGSMALASTLNVINGSLVTLLGGALDFIGGSGMYIAADVKFLPTWDVDLSLNNQVTANALQIEIAVDGWLALKCQSSLFPGLARTELGVLNSGGHLRVQRGVKFQVTGSVPGGNGFNLAQTAGWTRLFDGGRIALAEGGGMYLDGGTFLLGGFEKKAGAPTLQGDLTVNGGEVQFSGGEFTVLRVEGDVTWNGGSYQPRVDGSGGYLNCDRWGIVGSLSVGTVATIDPVITNANAAVIGDKWIILHTIKGCADNAPPITAGLQTAWHIHAPLAANGNSQTWSLRKL